MYLRKIVLRNALMALVISTVLTFVGWLLIYFGSRDHGLSARYVTGTVFLAPGELVSAIAAIIFSPQSFHGMSDYAWLDIPATLVIYFASSWLLITFFSFLRA